LSREKYAPLKPTLRLTPIGFDCGADGVDDDVDVVAEIPDCQVLEATRFGM